MEIVCDPDVRAVLAFMHREIPAARLVGVAASVAIVGPVLWGHYQPEAVQALRLAADPISAYGPRTQSGAMQLAPDLARVGDDSGAVVDCSPLR